MGFKAERLEKQSKKPAAVKGSPSGPLHHQQFQ
jgi:hypothetical protein